MIHPVISDTILDTIGHTPMVRINKLTRGVTEADVLAKLETFNPGNSIKDRMAVKMIEEAERAGLAIMAGCMVATSLAMAPAMLLAQRARFVDLDGPLLLAKDRADGLRYEGSLVYPATPALWG